MLNLFNKNRVKAGKQAQPNKSSDKKESPLVALKGSWKKLNSMDRKQAYTWGAVVLVGLVVLMLLGTASSNQPEDFTEYESRGYDLANMPFSSDEAEQYLLASKYPDMNGQNNSGLYSAEEKAARQAADEEEAEAQAAEDSSANGQDGNYRDSTYGGNAGRYYGGGSGSRGGSGAKTQVGQLSSASLKGASGSAVSGTFGPRGDFSNFKSQNKGSDKAPVGPGSGSARKALFQTAQGSRATAGIKDNRLINAKKAMMGGNIEGSKAFTDNGVDLSKASGLNLDTNAPVTTPGLQDLDDKLQKAKDKAEKKDQEDEYNEDKWWQDLISGLAEYAGQALVRIGEQALGGVIANAQETRRIEKAVFAKTTADVAAEYKAQAAAIEAYTNSEPYQDYVGKYEKWSALPEADRGPEPTPPLEGRPTVMLNVGGEQKKVTLDIPYKTSSGQTFSEMDYADQAKWFLANGKDSSIVNTAAKGYAQDLLANKTLGITGNNNSSGGTHLPGVTGTVQAVPGTQYYYNIADGRYYTRQGLEVSYDTVYPNKRSTN